MTYERKLVSRRAITVLAIVVLYLGALNAGAQSLDASATNETEVLRQKALDRSNSFRTFEGSYTASYANNEGVTTVESFQCRFRGDDLWLRDEMVEHSGQDSGNINPGDVFTMARLAGVTKYLMEKANNGEKIVELKREAPLFASQEIWPESTVGLERESGFRDLLQSASAPGGRTFVTAREGMDVLTYCAQGRGPRATDIYFDSGGRIVRVEYVFRPPCPPDDIRSYTGLEPFDVWGKDRSLELDDYRTFDGVDFPCHVTCTFWRIANHSELHPIEIQGANREISVCETYARCIAAERDIDVGTTTVVFDPDTIRINAPLSDDAFRLDIPKGAVVIDKETHVVTEPPVPWWRRHSDAVLYVGTLTLFALASIVGWRYWRQRY